MGHSGEQRGSALHERAPRERLAALQGLASVTAPDRAAPVKGRPLARAEPCKWIFIAGGLPASAGADRGGEPIHSGRLRASRLPSGKLIWALATFTDSCKTLLDFTPSSPDERPQAESVSSM